jgi:hypothetical protein
MFPFATEEDATAGDDTLGVVDCPRLDEGYGGLTMAFHGVLNTYIFRVATALLYKTPGREIGRKCKHSSIFNDLCSSIVCVLLIALTCICEILPTSPDYQ